MYVGLHAICVCNWNWKLTQDHFLIKHWSQRTHRCLAPVVGLEEYSAHDWRAATSVQCAPITWREWGLRTRLYTRKVTQPQLALTECFVSGLEKMSQWPCWCYDSMAAVWTVSHGQWMGDVTSENNRLCTRMFMDRHTGDSPHMQHPVQDTPS